jgi:eukaryotic-like serine/threonine-protein kinase
MASRSDVPATADPAPRFVLLGELASGGMGSVDLVRMIDASGERIAAMKRMHPQFSRDAEFVQMFRDEIWLTRELRHENAVELVGWGDDDEGPYLVMEFIDGAPLAEIVHQMRRIGKRLPEEIAAYVAARVADGLHAAHTLAGEDGQPLGLVHRDVTPSNVLVGFDGAIKITDFGIAKAAASSSHTRTGIVKGKLEYMSPEQALRRAVDGRSDLYSLGAVLFEIFAGEPPVCGGSDLDLLKRIVYEAVPPLASRAPEVDPELAALVDGMLSKSAEQRPPDGAAVAGRLDTWLSTRGLFAAGLSARLSELAARHGAARRRRLRKLLEIEGTELASSSSWRDPKRVRAAALPGPGTFLRAASPGSTRAVPVAPGPALQPFAPAPLPPAPPSAPAPEPRATRRLALAASPPAAVPAAKPRAPWLAVLSGIALALLLVGAVALIGVRSARSVASASVEPELGAVTRPEAPEAPPGPAAFEPAPPPVPDPEPEAAIRPAEAAATAPRPAAPKAGAGQKRPPAARVQSTAPSKSRSKPCTPDRFDYPACLSAR